MKKPLKKVIPAFLLGLLILGSYTYVCQQEYFANSMSAPQLQEQLKESTAQFIDLKLVQQLIDFVLQNLSHP